MTHQNDYTLTSDLAEKGLDAVPELLRVLINNVMQAERSKYLQAGQYERTEDRKGHANGYKPKTVRTRMGEITFAVPQVREGGFYPTALEKGMRSERALVTTLAEMYVQGVSTRKVKASARPAAANLERVGQQRAPTGANRGAKGGLNPKSWSTCNESKRESGTTLRRTRR